MGLQESNGLDVGGWSPTTTPPPRRHTTTDVFRLVKSLERIESHDWKTWNNIGLALKNESPDLFNIWEAWSLRSHKSRGCDLRAEWDKLQPNGGVTLGTVFHLGKEEPEIKLFGAQDLLNLEFKRDWIIENLLAKKTAMGIFALEKSFKTTTAMYASCCISKGLPFLGMSTTKQRVGVFSGESGLDKLQSMVARMSAQLGTTIQNDELLISSWTPHFKRTLPILGKLIEDHGLEVVIVDPAYLCMDGENANNGFEMGQQLKEWTDVCLDRGCTPLILHHLNKGAWQKGRFKLSDVAWAGFREWAPSWMGIRKETEYRAGKVSLLLDVGGRDGQDLEMIVNIDEGNVTERTWNVSWQYRSEFIAGKKQQQVVEKDNTHRSRVLATLSNAGEPMICSAIKNESGNRFVTKQFLADMADEGLISIVKIKRGGKTVPHYQLAEAV